MSGHLSLRRLVSLLVYFTAFTLGTSLFVIDPVRVLLVVPLLTGVVLLGHAAKTGHLDEVGYAVVWLWGAVFALSVGGLVVEIFLLYRDIPALVDIPVARILGTVMLTAVPVTVYLRGVQRTRRERGSSIRTA